MTHYSDQNKLDKIVKEATSNSEDTEKALTAILNKLALEDFTLFDKCTLDEKNCNCESCNGKRCLAAYSLEELKAIQTYWLELRQYIRIVYRLSMKGSLKNIDNEYRDYMKDIVSRLCDACDPHQLYIKLEAQVKEFVIEIKVRLLQLMDRLAENPQLPRLFISGLLDRYNKMMNAAHEITPVLIQLEAQHLVKFNLTWKILNQRLFQTNIYSDLFFQNSVPLFITQLGKARDSEDNKKLVRDFLRFDDEISHVEEIWGDIEARIRQYMLTEVTPIPKEFTRGDGSKMLGSPLFPPNCDCHVCIEEVPPDNVGEIDEIIPLSPKTASFHLLSHIHGNREESVLSVYPPVFESTGLPTDHDPEHEMWCRDNLPTREGITKEMLEHHSCQLSKSESVDKSAQKALEINGICKEFERLEENYKGGSPGGKGKTEGHNLHCSKHTEAMRRMQLNAFEDGFLDTDSSDSGPTDPRHCDCCYCEVFGHGMPPTAPMSKNYQEMRERLRLLLNKKKLKCKSSPVSTTPQTTQKKQPPTSTVANSSNTAQDTRALEDLLDFIEGNEVKCRDEKKAAKKARQKEKKRVQLIRKKMEEEEQAKKIRQHEEELKRKALEEEAKRKRREEANAAVLKAASAEKQKASVKLKKKAKTTPQAQSGGTANPGADKPSPQMVTIKRVMEPHNSEPTVTITLRGATPNQDRVLYTLLNGQVCKVKDMPQEKVSVSTKETQTKDGKIQAKSKSCGNNNVAKPPTNVPIRPKEPPSKNIKPRSEPVRPKSQISSKLVTAKTNKEVTSNSSVQINNGVHISKSSSSTSSFNIADIKLPPGITITKVDPSNVQPRNPKIQEHSVKKVVTNSKQDIRCSSDVIVVSTSKKEPQEIKGSLPEQESKKKRNRKKNNGQMITNGKPTGYPGLEIEPISLLDKDISNHMSVLTISPYQDQEGSREHQWVADNGKKKKKKSKKSPVNNLINPEEWQLLESVFAPKDIDLDDGEMDDAERELEAFKRFCLQSIPPERKEKVHLNIKDIVLKKKSSPYN